MSGAVTFSLNPFKQGDKVINLGIGFGNTLHSGSGFSMKVPPISGSFEYCVKDNLFDANSSLGIGGMVGYASYEYKQSYAGYNTKVKYSDLVFGVRGALHYNFVEKLDTYAGVSLGYHNVSNSVSTTGLGSYSGSVDGNGFFAGFYVGGRYYFAENLGVMAELGYDIAVLSVGISYKF